MADDTLIVRPTFFARVLKSIGLLPTGEVEFIAGADYSAHQAAEPQYPKNNSMSAFGSFTLASMQSVLTSPACR